MPDSRKRKPGSHDLLAMLGVEHPIILAPMAGGTSTPALVAAVSNAGGLGSLGAAYLGPQEILDAVAAIRRLTDKPINVNLFAAGRTAGALTPDRIGDVRPMQALLGRHAERLGVAGPQLPSELDDPFEAQLAAVFEADVEVFSFTFGLPAAPAMSALRKRGIVTMGTATTVREAKALEDAGVDVVVTQGAEAGGHRGTFLGAFESSLVGSFALVPQVVDAVSVPVVAAGGIMDGRGVAAALALGATGVQLGTAFLVCDESGASEAYKAAVLAAADDETRITRAFTGRPARSVINAFMREIDESAAPIPPFPVQQALAGSVRAAAAARGDVSMMPLLAGQGTRLTRRQGAADLVHALVRQSLEVRRQLASPSEETIGESR